MTAGPPPAPGERTPEEREAARREREARRAARRGAESDGGKPPGRDWLAEARRWLAGDGRKKRNPEREMAKAPPLEATPPRHASPRETPPRQPPAAAPRQAAPRPLPREGAAPRQQPRQAAPPPRGSTAEHPAAKPAAAAPPPAAQTAEHPAAAAPPVPSKPPAQAPPVPQDGAPAGARERRTESADRLRRISTRKAPPHGRGRLRAGRLVVALTLLALLGLAGWFAASLFQPFKGDAGQEVRVAVPRGASLDQIAELLESRGIVASSFFFQTRARLAGRSEDLKPGSYVLREDMSYSAALAALEKGTPPNIVVLTIPEGRSRQEVAQLVDGQLEGGYMQASRRSPVLDPREYRAENARDLEGFLFPATYELKKGRPMSALVEQQLKAFRERFEQVDLSYARRKKLTPYDVLTIASLVEREAVLAKERRLIASVIYNRLKEGMPLGIDATVRYVTGNWTEPLKQSELANPSPYNTRLNAGLPPGPIGSPGIESIRAAARPARTDYLFFVVKPGGDGAHAFASTDAEHQRNVERYHTARDALGGRSPD
jgi:UPF0755 protein